MSTTPINQVTAGAAASGFHDGVAATQSLLLRMTSEMSYSEALMIEDIVMRLMRLRYSDPDYLAVYETDSFHESEQLRLVIKGGDLAFQL